MNDIQKARDVLKKWRNDSQMTGRWDVPEIGYAVIRTDDNDDTLAYATSDANARMIVGTAGNPDLLDAIDVLLSFAQAAVIGRNGGHFGSMVGQSHIIAAAIIAADERMQQ